MGTSLPGLQSVPTKYRVGWGGGGVDGEEKGTERRECTGRREGTGRR